MTGLLPGDPVSRLRTLLRHRRVAIDSTPSDPQPAEGAADSEPAVRPRRPRAQRLLIAVLLSALLLLGLVATGAAFDADHGVLHALPGLFGGPGGCGGG